MCLIITYNWLRKVTKNKNTENNLVVKSDILPDYLQLYVIIKLRLRCFWPNYLKSIKNGIILV